MAEVLQLNDLLEVKLYSQAAEQVAINVLHYKVTAVAMASAEIDQAAVDLEIAFNLPMRQLMGTQAAFKGLGIRRFTTGAETVEYYAQGVMQAGTISSDLLPRQAAGIITKRTATPGRRGRGRLYAPFPTEVSNDTSGLPTGAYVALLNTLGLEITSPQTVGDAIGGNTATLSPVLLSRVAGPIARPLIDYVSRSKWGTQRRRGSYGAANQLPF